MESLIVGSVDAVTKRRVVLRTPVWTGAVFAWSAFMAALCVPGIVDPVAGEPIWIPAAALPLLVAMAVRALVVGVAVTGSDVVVRNFVSTRRVGRDEVADVRLVNYSGFLAWRSWGGVLWAKSVEIRTAGGRVVRVYGLLGSTRAIEARAQRLRARVGLPVSGREPRHQVNPRSARFTGPPA